MSDFQIPMIVILENIRSLHNVGAFFRTCDGIQAQRLILTGYTPFPPRSEITKTALGAENTVPWEYYENIEDVLEHYKQEKRVIIGVETGEKAIHYSDFIPQFPCCVIFGNEILGITQKTLSLCDFIVSIPMNGIKESLNVSVAGGIILYNFYEKYKEGTKGKTK